MSFKLLSIACLLLSVVHAAPHGSTSETLPSGQNIYSPDVKYTHNQYEQLYRRSSDEDDGFLLFGDGVPEYLDRKRFRKQYRKEAAEREAAERAAAEKAAAERKAAEKANQASGSGSKSRQNATKQRKGKNQAQS
ncbi:hypothetical protein HI914_00476 [Erysiphe necator]|nr:hypothetical protein HI914_00476 [Erysiphe necator]